MVKAVLFVQCENVARLRSESAKCETEGSGAHSERLAASGPGTETFVGERNCGDKDGRGPEMVPAFTKNYAAVCSRSGLINNTGTVVS
jgi:hypothetical protein